ncbi:MAG: DnaD domain protein [Coprobacillaceae bacterium]
MLKYLKDAHCIDYAKLLLLRAKELNITDNECHILLLIMTLQDMDIKTITPPLLLEYATVSNKELDTILASLINKKRVSNRMGSITLEPIEDFLLVENKREIEEVQEVSILEVYEAEFGRSLSPMELSYLRTWKEEFGYSDEMLIQALKEAVKSQVLSFRYMEAILNNWSKTGITSRYADTSSEEEDIEVSEYPWWDDE